MKYDTFVIFTILPVSFRDFQRFGIEYLLNKQHKVIVFNVKSLLHNSIDLTHQSYQVSDPNYTYREISSYAQLSEELHVLNPKKTIVFIIIGYEQSIKIHSVLTHYNFIYGSFFFSIPNPFAQSSKLSKLKTRLLRIKKINFSDIALKLQKKISAKISKKLFHIKKYDFVINGGSESLKTVQNADAKTLIINAHSLDKDFMINTANKISTEYIIFLDQYIPFHSDFKLVGMNIESIADTYFSKMNKFLNELSALYDAEVIICAHPRADYAKHPNVWENKKIVYGKTFEYVSQAKFCLTHASTSINFAVLLQKPVQLVIFKEIDFYMPYIKLFADNLGNNIIDLDRTANVKEIDFYQYDSSRYQTYIHKYIDADNTDKRLFWDKVYSALKDL